MNDAHRAVIENNEEGLRKLYNTGYAHLFSQIDEQRGTPLDLAATMYDDTKNVRCILLLVNGGGTLTRALTPGRAKPILERLQTPQYPGGQPMPKFIRDLPVNQRKSPRIVQAFKAADMLAQMKERGLGKGPLDITVAMKAGAYDDELAPGVPQKFLYLFAQMQVKKFTKHGTRNSFEVLMLEHHRQYLRAIKPPQMERVTVYNLSEALQRAIETVMIIIIRLKSQPQGAIQSAGGALPALPPELWFVIIRHLMRCVKPYEYSRRSADQTFSNFGLSAGLAQLLRRE